MGKHRISLEYDPTTSRVKLTINERTCIEMDASELATLADLFNDLAGALNRRGKIL